jgi:hypothetical protein
MRIGRIGVIQSLSLQGTNGYIDSSCPIYLVKETPKNKKIRA